jgi:hypothetical protein
MYCNGRPSRSLPYIREARSRLTSKKTSQSQNRASRDLETVVPRILFHWCSREFDSDDWVIIISSGGFFILDMCLIVSMCVDRAFYFGFQRNGVPFSALWLNYGGPVPVSADRFIELTNKAQSICESPSKKKGRILDD